MEQAAAAQSAPADQAQSAPNTSSEGFAVPEAYAGKAWAKDIKGPDDLWKLTDNAQSLIGKRAVPAADASDEEWNGFFKQAGKPDDKTGYALPDIEGLPDGFDLAPYKETALDLMHQAGLNNRQAAALWKGYIAAEAKAAVDAKAGGSAKDEEFSKYAQQLFGEASGAVQEATIEDINSLVSKETRDAALEGLIDNPRQLTLLMEMSKGYRQKMADLRKQYGQEDKLGSEGEGASGQGIEETVKELAALRSSDEYRDPTSPKFRETVEKVNEMSARVQRHYNKR